MLSTDANYQQTTSKPTDGVATMLEQSSLHQGIINKVLTSLNCAKERNVGHNNILTVIDYSIPSSEKRLWVFDLNERKLLFNTYVSHGIRSGFLLSQYFSNKYDSKASSIGVYQTEQTYYGREGLSLRLDGLERGFNDNASGRYVVMHGGWYVEENFIKKYGRPGRSWGCPAIPEDQRTAIINTIKDKTIFVIYYPSDDWFNKSRFLNCKNASANYQADEVKPIVEDNTPREPILFADINKNNQREEHEPIVVISADNYINLFHKNAPLDRMLRRQINTEEYIALSSSEFNSIINDKTVLNNLYMVVPVVKMERGYYETHMEVVKWGKMKEVNRNASELVGANSYSASFDSKSSVNLKSTSHFIRWLGL